MESCTKYVNTHLLKCAFETSNKSQLREHERNEHAFYKCTSDHKSPCDNLNSENIQNNDRKAFKCEKCESFYETAGQMETHAMVHEEAVSELRCDQCDLKSKDVPQIKHIRTSHKSEHCKYSDHTAKSGEDLKI